MNKLGFKSLTIICAVAAGVFLYTSNNHAVAVNYGSGNYGECVFGGEIGDNALTFTVDGTALNFGNLSTAAVSTATTTFSVALQCSDLGYIVTANGAAPDNGTHTLTALVTPTASSPGTEQYGLNVVDNATPNVGADPSGGIGTASTDYDTADLFKYVSGETIAEASQNSDTTSYTLSTIVNQAQLTSQGNYTGTHELICVSTY